MPNERVNLSQFENDLPLQFVLAAITGKDACEKLAADAAVELGVGRVVVEAAREAAHKPVGGRGSDGRMTTDFR